MQKWQPMVFAMRQEQADIGIVAIVLEQMGLRHGYSELIAQLQSCR